MFIRTLILLFVISPFTLHAESINVRGEQEATAPVVKQESNQEDVDAFIESIKKGDVSSVERWLAAGMSANAKDGNERPPLLLAIQTGRLNVIKALLAKGANVDAEYKTWTALGLAAHNGRLDIVKLLIEKGANVNLESECHHTALILATEGAMLRAMTAFIRPRIFLPEMSNSEDFELGDGRDIIDAHLEIVKLLLDKGADPNVASDCETGDWSATPLVTASMGGNVELVKLLLAHGADPNRKTAASALWLLTHDNDMMSEEIYESDSNEEKLQKQALNDWRQSLKPAHAQIIELLKRAGAKDEPAHEDEGSGTR